jgi:transcriptional regulator with XRE-family HTH domain
MDKEWLLSNLGTRIKRARREREMTQEELAVAMEVTSITISRWETGKQSPDYPTLCQLAQILEVTLPSLVENNAVAAKKSRSADGADNLPYNAAMKREANISLNFGYLLRDVARLNPDVIVMIQEPATLWEILSDAERQVFTDGLAFVFGSFWLSHIRPRRDR